MTVKFFNFTVVGQHDTTSTTIVGGTRVQFTGRHQFTHNSLFKWEGATVPTVPTVPTVLTVATVIIFVVVVIVVVGHRQYLGTDHAIWLTFLFETNAAFFSPTTSFTTVLAIMT